MQAAYKIEAGRNYLVMDCGDGCEFEQRMLKENHIRGILSGEVRHLNNRTFLYYPVMGMQNIKAYFTSVPLKEEEFCRIVGTLNTLSKILPEYFLGMEKLNFNPELIFKETATGSFYFIYETNVSKEKKGLEELAEFFLEVADHSNEKFIDLIYAFYEEAGTGAGNLEHFVTGGEEPTKYEARYNMEEAEENDEEESSEEIFEEHEETSKNILKIDRSVLCVLFGGGLSLLSTLFLWLAGLPYVLYVIPAFLLIFTAITYSMFRKKKPLQQETEEEEWEYSEYLPLQEETDTGTETDQDNTVFFKVEEYIGKLYGIGKYKRYKMNLSSFPYTIGKEEKSGDYAIREEGVSRMHARVLKEEGKIFLMDLNSTNGTFVNGLRLEPYKKMELQPEDEIGFGKVMFVYR